MRLSKTPNTPRTFNLFSNCSGKIGPGTTIYYYTWDGMARKEFMDAPFISILTMVKSGFNKILQRRD